MERKFQVVIPINGSGVQAVSSVATRPRRSRRGAIVTMTLYVIEKRNSDGSLDLSEPQPEKFFGMNAITGITDDEMYRIVWQHDRDARCFGTNIPRWPAYVHPRFVARTKYW